MLPTVADVVLSFYFGASQTRPSDLHIVQQQRANDATMHDVTWRGYPFRFEIYYGLRLTYTAPYHPAMRIALDYTHFKIYAATNDRVAQSGTWHGNPLHETAPMRERVQSIEMTHGLNMLGLLLLQRVTGSGGGAFYIGGGPVMFVPHTESRVDSLQHETGYRFGGAGFQVAAGVRGCVRRHPVFVESKYSNGAPVAGIAQGWAQTGIHTLHELAGIDFRACK